MTISFEINDIIISCRAGAVSDAGAAARGDGGSLLPSGVDARSRWSDAEKIHLKIYVNIK
jgi:hypothetical protein